MHPSIHETTQRWERAALCFARATTSFAPSIICRVFRVRRNAWRTALLRLAGLLGVLAAALSSAHVAAIPAAERAALEAIYDNTNGAGWRDSTGWKGAVGSECTWYGVVCNSGNLNVTELRLNANTLLGALPASLNQLTQLALLFASRNKLSGSIPALTGLTQLEDIELNENQLTGPIPSLQGLASLRLVFLDRNKLSGSIPALNQLANLERFSVDTNQLTGSIPPLLGLKKLDLLTLTNNQLTGPIPPLTDLSALQRFNVYNNQLSGDVPAVPSPTSLLFADASQLCPNALTPSVNVAWDTASRVKPWSNGCTAAVLTAQTISFTPSSPVTITPSQSGTSATLSATGGGSGNPIVFRTASALTVCTVNGTTVTYFGAGNCVITADQAGNATFSAAPQVTAIVVVQIAGLLPQVITNFAPASPVTLNIAPTATTATLTATGGGSTSPIVFSASSASSICTVTGNVVTYLGVGICRLNADQAGDATFSAAPIVSVNVTVQLIPQVILGFNPATPVTVGTAPATLTALAGESGIPAVYATTSPATICTVSGTTLTYVGAGNCVVTANRPGNANFSAAPEVQRSIAITNAVTVTVPSAPIIAVATPGNDQAVIAFTAPTLTGGASIIDYTVTCNPAATATGTTSPVVVSGLTNGITYSCVVTARNSAGSGAASTAVQVTPAGVVVNAGPVNVPTLSQWAVLWLALIAAGLGVVGLRYRQS